MYIHLHFCLIQDFGPKTLEVTGVCRLNPEERDESKWVWGKCPGSIPFDELWFAVRGGGGGWVSYLSSVFDLFTNIQLTLVHYLIHSLYSPQ